MLKRNAPLLAFALVFVAVLYFVYSIPQYEPIVDVEEEEEVPEEAFTGRVEMPSIDEIYVIENTAGRDLNKLAMFLEGRAAGLHYLSSEYFKKIRVTRKGNRFIKSDDDVFLGENGHAMVVSELCIMCGNCVINCPAKAKHVRDDIQKAKQLQAYPQEVRIF